MSRSGYRFIAILYTAVILAVSVIPSDRTPGGIPHVDKILHLVMFAVLGFLLGAGHFDRRIVVLLWVVLSASCSELLQLAAPSRDPDFLDWIFDLIGGVTAYYIVLRHRTPAPQETPDHGP